MADVDQQGLDLQSAADRLGVHYQTAYRWVRTGRLRAGRVDGRYVIGEDAIDAVEADRTARRDLPQPRPDRIAGQADRMYGLLVEGREPEARRLVRRFVDEGATVIDVVEQLLVEPLRRIGEAWSRGDVTIWVEHRAAAIVERVLGDVVPNPRGRRRGLAVVAAVAGEQHSLPTTMAAVALRADQWRVHHLGADLPTAELLACCVDHQADLAVISVTNVSGAHDAAAAARLLRETAVRVLVGGPGRSLTELVDAARSSRAAARAGAS